DVGSAECSSIRRGQPRKKWSASPPSIESQRVGRVAGASRRESGARKDSWVVAGRVAGGSAARVVKEIARRRIGIRSGRGGMSGSIPDGEGGCFKFLLVRGLWTGAG